MKYLGNRLYMHREETIAFNHTIIIVYVSSAHTARALNLRHDFITAKVSSVTPKHSDWYRGL